MDFIFGDPYTAEPVVRGVHMSGPVDGSLAKHSNNNEQLFMHGDKAPGLPQHPFFQLQRTRVFVRTSLPHLLGNCLVEFLHSRLSVPTAPLKVRCAKFTAKADVCHVDNTCQVEGECTVKLRVYWVSDDLFVVELQRRAGDAVACAGIFRELTEHLDECQHASQFSLEADEQQDAALPQVDSAWNAGWLAQGDPWEAPVGWVA